MRKYTTSELAQLYDKKDWATLWKIMQPMVKHEVRRCMQQGLIDPIYVTDDLMQEAYLAAWECLPRWNAFEAGLRRWVGGRVRSAVLDAARHAAGGMVGGRDARAVVVSIHGETPEDDWMSNEEQGINSGLERVLAYEEPSEDFRDPLELVDEGWLREVPEKDRDMVRRLAGVGCARETQDEFAEAEGLHRDTVTRRLRALRNYFSAKTPQSRDICSRPASKTGTG